MSKNGKVDNTGPILLTGAGFTQNFGGFLAQDMWALIFNHKEVGESANLRSLLRNDFDYESVYHQILYEGRFVKEEDSVKEKTIIKRVIRESYNHLDRAIVEANHGGNYLPETKSFIENFSGLKEGGGFFFTLNQDLFVERYFAGLGGIHIPFSNRANSIWASLRDKHLDVSHYITLPRAHEDLEKEEPLSVNKFHYIKLHGSLNWQGSDGSDALVIGKLKKSDLVKEPLLDKYFSLFTQEVTKSERKMLCIGYGFGDTHIMKIFSKVSRVD